MARSSSANSRSRKATLCCMVCVVIAFLGCAAAFFSLILCVDLLLGGSQPTALVLLISLHTEPANRIPTPPAPAAGAGADPTTVVEVGAVPILPADARCLFELRSHYDDFLAAEPDVERSLADASPATAARLFELDRLLNVSGAREAEQDVPLWLIRTRCDVDGLLRVVADTLRPAAAMGGSGSDGDSDSDSDIEEPAAETAQQSNEEEPSDSAESTFNLGQLSVIVVDQSTIRAIAERIAAVGAAAAHSATAASAAEAAAQALASAERIVSLAVEMRPDGVDAYAALSLSAGCERHRLASFGEASAARAALLRNASLPADDYC